MEREVRSGREGGGGEEVSWEFVLCVCVYMRACVKRGKMGAQGKQLIG